MSTVSRSGQVIDEVDLKTEYGGLEATELKDLTATMSDFVSRLFLPWSTRKTVMYTLLAAVMPATSRCWGSGLVTVAATTTAGPGSYTPTDIGMKRITGWEVWNFEASNSISVTGGGLIGSIVIKPGFYYTKDINCSGDGAPTIVNSNASTSSVQVVINGI